MKRLLFIFLGCLLYAKAELVVITHRDCPVCKRWHEEVSPHYDKTARIKRYPQKRLYDIEQADAQKFVIEKIGYIRSIPFFAVMEDDKVISQFEGYSDEKSFFEDLEKALKMLPGTDSNRRPSD